MNSLWQTRLAAGLHQLDVRLTDQQQQQLLDYVALLDKWNRTYNLTAVRDPLEMITRHLLDSLALLPWLDHNELTDVGSGAGLPGIPLAIARPDLQVVSLDAVGKKIRFQQQAARQLKLQNFDACQTRVEAWQPSRPVKRLVSRAFASLSDFIVLTASWADEDARWLAMKGHLPRAEIEALPTGYACVAQKALQVPGLAEQRHLLWLAKTSEG